LNIIIISAILLQCSGQFSSGDGSLEVGLITIKKFNS